MNPIERHKYIQELADKAKMHAPDNPMSWLNENCKEDTEGVKEALRLLDAAEQAEAKGFLGKPSPLRQIIEDHPTGIEYLSTNGDSASPPDGYGLVGRTLAGSYQVKELVGKGGMGWVYRATQLELNRDVAIKTLDRYLMLSKARSVEHFVSEAQIPAHLDHPGIVKVITSGRTPDNIHYIVMEWVDGKTLASEIRPNAPFSFERAGNILKQVAEAIAIAHSRKVLHLDIKPSNIMLKNVDNQEIVKILDFGVAKSSFETNYSQATLGGTPAYTSPEQSIEGNSVDARADIYSLGVVLYEMLTGMPPFEASNLLQLMRQHSESPRPSLLKIRPDATAALDKLVRGMMEIDPDKRQPQKIEDLPHLYKIAIAPKVALTQREVLKHWDEWLKYAEQAWDAAGRPDKLDPRTLEDNPVAYDKAYYEYFEQRYAALWNSVYEAVKPNGSKIRASSSAFRDAWRRNFLWGTIWKQILPLFIYGEILRVNNQVIVELASYYAIAQGIPSIVIDRMLDDCQFKERNSEDAAFCLAAYLQGLQGIRSLSVNPEIEDYFVSQTRFMYDSMLSESVLRYSDLAEDIDESVSRYTSSTNRLLSSVFFGILPRWAYLLAGRPVPDEVSESFDCLRRVRQLNDEIADVMDDLAAGLVTLPWLLALKEDPTLQRHIKNLWANRTNEGYRSRCWERLVSTQGLKLSCDQSLALLSKSMMATANNFSATESFALTAMHNVRWAHLLRITNNGYVDTSALRQPNIPVKKTQASLPNQLTPVPGAGTVCEKGGKVLMSLCLKRGMIRWELPAGVRKTGELLEDTAQREAFEETGKHVRVDEPIALCWHYSQELNKGWMGIFFEGHVLENMQSTELLSVINPEALQSKILGENPFENKMYYTTNKLSEFDFEAFYHNVRQLSSLQNEVVLASGFIDWRQIPEARIHPVHRLLLEAYSKEDLPDFNTENKEVIFLVCDADTDIQFYDEEVCLYMPK